MNEFNVQVGLMKVYYERFVYYFRNSFANAYIPCVRTTNISCVNVNTYTSNVFLLNKEDELHEIITVDVEISSWTTGGRPC